MKVDMYTYGTLLVLILTHRSVWFSCESVNVLSYAELGKSRIAAQSHTDLLGAEKATLWSFSLMDWCSLPGPYCHRHGMTEQSQMLRTGVVSLPWSPDFLFLFDQRQRQCVCVKHALSPLPLSLSACPAMRKLAKSEVRTNINLQRPAIAIFS